MYCKAFCVARKRKQLLRLEAPLKINDPDVSEKSKKSLKNIWSSFANIFQGFC